MKLFEKLSGLSEFFWSAMQILFVFMVLPGFFYLVVLLLPEEFSGSILDLISNFGEDIPLFQSVFGMVKSVFSLTSSPEAVTVFLSEFVSNIGNNIVEAMTAGMCVSMFKEINVILRIPGVPAVAVMLGTFFGVFVLSITSGLPFHIRVIILIVLIIINVVLILVPKSAFDLSSKPKKIIQLIMIGFQAVIVTYFMFFLACVLTMISQRLTGFYQILTLWILPAIIMIAMIALDYYVATAKSYSWK